MTLDIYLPAASRSSIPWSAPEPDLDRAPQFLRAASRPPSVAHNLDIEMVRRLAQPIAPDRPTPPAQPTNGTLKQEILRTVP